jgi:hypothetical protein
MSSKQEQAFAELAEPAEASLRLVYPLRGWEPALTRLVLHARCPWCDQPISRPTVTADILSWACAGGCNP